MRINNLSDKLDSLGQKFLQKYKSESSDALAADINRIINYLKQDHGNKQIHEIDENDLEEDIKSHILKDEDPLKSKNTIYKYIGRWYAFLEFLRIDETLTHTHIFIEKITNLKEFKTYIAKKYKLNDEETTQAYETNKVLKVIKAIDYKLLNKLTDDQRYRLIQQSIFIQLTLLSGLPRRNISNIMLDDIKDNKIVLNGYDIILPKNTKRYIDDYIKLRKNNCNHKYLFTDIKGEELTNSTTAGNMFSSNMFLVNIFKENTDLIDEDISCISNNAIRNAAILEMIKTKEDLYTIIKLTGLSKSSLKELDELYIQISNNEKSKLHINLKRNINILIMRLPYYDKFNGDELFFVDKKKL